MHLPALTSYLQGLRENNNKAWFVMNKPAYDILRPEFTVMVSAVIAGLGKRDRTIALVEPRKSLFRIYRDIRFSNDKTPYKTYFSASIAEPAAQHSGPMYYLSINADGRLHMGAGCWMPERDVLARIRGRIVEDPAALARTLRKKDLVATFGTLSVEDKLQRLPKGYAPDMPGIERFGDWLRLKSFVLSKDIDLMAKANAKVRDALPETIVETLSAATPFNDWLRRAMSGG